MFFFLLARGKSLPAGVISQATFLPNPYLYRQTRTIILFYSKPKDMKSHKLWVSASFLMLAALLLSTSLYAQRTTGNGNVVEQERAVGNFDVIKVQKGIDLYITQGSPAALTVKADENILDQIITRVDGKTLYLDVQGSVRNARAMDVFVTLENLSELHASGGSDVFAEDGLKLKELKLFCSGGSDTRMAIEAETLHCNTSGGSDAVLSGKVNELIVESSGGSDFDAKKLEAVKCKIRASGASDAWVFATGEIDIEASGASDIHYKGGAKKISSKASGGADIHGN